MKNEIENIIVFLKENEQYGDDWKNEIEVLEKILENTKFLSQFEQIQ
jgi:hypothetical protein